MPSSPLKPSTPEPGPSRRWTGTGWLLGLILPLAVVVVWEVLATHHLINDRLTPAPSRVWATLVKLAASGELLTHIIATLRRVVLIREQVLVSFEKAERLDSESEAAKYLNFVVIGGGPTGVEMAGAIAEIAHTALFKNFRRIKPEKARIFLIEATPYILPVYPEKALPSC